MIDYQRNFHTSQTSFQMNTKQTFAQIYERTHQDLVTLYRQPVDLSLLNQFTKERESCRMKIDDLNSFHGGTLFRNKILREIRAAHDVQLSLMEESSSREIGPSRKYEYFYSSEGHYLRRPVSSAKLSHNNEELVIELSPDLTGPMSLSFDEEYIAYLHIELKDKEPKVKLTVRHITSGKESTLSYQQNGSIANLEFGVRIDDSPTEKKYALYFTTNNELHRPDSVWCCYFNPDLFSFSESEFIMRDSNEAHFVDITRTKGGKYMVINSTSKTSNEVFIIMPDKLSDAPIVVKKREDGVNYFVDCGTSQNDIYILAHKLDNYPVPSSLELDEDLTVFQASIEELPITSRFGRKILGSAKRANKTSFIEEIDIFEKYIALYERNNKDGTQQIRIVPKENASASYTITAPPEQVGHIPALSPGGNIQYESTKLSFSASSLLTPSISYELDMETGKISHLSQLENISIASKLLESYEQKKVLIQSKDKTMIPLSLVYRKQNEEDIGVNGRPTLLLGYGAYGVSQDLAFDPSLFPLLNRGWVIAVAHTRGGGELGKKWYQQGRLFNKEKCMEDYLACAQALIDPQQLNITRPSKLAGKGVSAGGVMVASVAITRAPELFSAVILKSPFLDVLGTMMDTTLPLTEHEFGEWGDPKSDEKIKKVIERYCPLHNLQPSNFLSFPTILLIGAIDDNNVPFWNPALFASKARGAIGFHMEGNGAMHDVDANVLLHIEESGGHHFHDKWSEISSIEISFLCGVIT